MVALTTIVKGMNEQQMQQSRLMDTLNVPHCKCRLASKFSQLFNTTHFAHGFHKLYCFKANLSVHTAAHALNYSA